MRHNSFFWYFYESAAFTWAVLMPKIIIIMAFYDGYNYYNSNPNRSSQFGCTTHKNNFSWMYKNIHILLDWWWKKICQHLYFWIKRRLFMKINFLNSELYEIGLAQRLQSLSHRVCISSESETGKERDKAKRKSEKEKHSA